MLCRVAAASRSAPLVATAALTVARCEPANPAAVVHRSPKRRPASACSSVPREPAFFVLVGAGRRMRPWPGRIGMTIVSTKMVSDGPAPAESSNSTRSHGRHAHHGAHPCHRPSPKHLHGYARLCVLRYLGVATHVTAQGRFPTLAGYRPQLGTAAQERSLVFSAMNSECNPTLCVARRHFP